MGVQHGLQHYLSGYPPAVLAEAQWLLDQRRIGALIAARYPLAHTVRTDRALYDFVSALKSEFMRSAEPIAKVVYDARMQVMQHTLGTHTTVSRVQGTRLKAKREIRVASVFRQAPAAFLKMIAVHELAHLKEREHGRAFYALCLHMEPAYHQLEFDVRLWLAAREVEG